MDYTSNGANAGYNASTLAKPADQFTASSNLPTFMNAGEGFSPTIYYKDGNGSSNATIGYGHKLTTAEIQAGVFAK